MVERLPTFKKNESNPMIVLCLYPEELTPWDLDIDYIETEIINIPLIEIDYEVI